MSIFRTYFSKCDTIIKDNYSNNSHNPVTEISYGTFQKQLSRFIFDVDLSNLNEKISQGIINPNRIVKHVLHMTNTIRYASEYVGKKSYSLNIQRASSFDLDLFNIDENWDEGSGYDFIYNDTIIANPVIQASNWFYSRTDTPWINEGVYISGTSKILGTQHFDNGNENITIDVTDYINQRLNVSGSTTYSGNTAYSGNTYGLGLKFQDIYESIETELRYAIAFHTKYTNTWYEPYIETIIDDIITDDRNYFYLDKDNDLYLYANVGGLQENIIVDKVNIYDNDGEIYLTLSGDSITRVSKGIYKITLNIDSELYPDAIMFRDEWILKINGKTIKHVDDFYLISQEKYYTFDNSNQINFNNYYFYFSGICENECISSGDIRKIELKIKQLYENQNNLIPLDIEYRIYTTLGKKYEIDVIPFTHVDRTNNGYCFNIDTSWLIPQDYHIQIRLKNGNYYMNKEILSFTVVSNKII